MRHLFVLFVAFLFFVCYWNIVCGAKAAKPYIEKKVKQDVKCFSYCMILSGLMLSLVCSVGVIILFGLLYCLRLLY